MCARAKEGNKISNVSIKESFINFVSDLASACAGVGVWLYVKRTLSHSAPGRSPERERDEERRARRWLKSNGETERSDVAKLIFHKRNRQLIIVLKSKR